MSSEFPGTATIGYKFNASPSSRLNYAQFSAEDELITIIPKFKMPEIQLIRGQFGPFYESIPISVPLWMALTLRKTNRCVIKPPTYGDLEYLDKLIADEKQLPNQFSEVPYYMREVLSSLLHHVPQDFKKPALVRIKMEEFFNIRLNKYRSLCRSSQQLSETEYLLFPAITSSEINSLKPSLVEILNTYGMLKEKVPMGSQSGYTQPIAPPENRRTNFRRFKN